MEIRADREVCVAAGMCARTAPAYFDQATDDGRVVVLREKVDPDDVDEALEAVTLCPSGALSLVDVGEPGAPSPSNAITSRRGSPHQSLSPHRRWWMQALLD